MNRQPHTKSAPSSKYSTAASRWAGVGPYYAMFPSSFADRVVEEHTSPGDAVLDPFAGRGTAVFSAAVRKRPAIGVEINPLGYVYANTKLRPGTQEKVVCRLEELEELAPRQRRAADALPPFFHHCFAAGVRRFLLAARKTLDWRRSDVDRTLMAFILIALHGKRYQSLSNQLRQSTAMAPDYCVRWWTEKGMTPPDIDPVAHIRQRIAWRYAHGAPQTEDAAAWLGDSVRKLPQLAADIQAGKRPRIQLLLTSPPYHNVTNYSYDQWLRLWLLGGPQRPESGNQYGGKFSNLERYRRLLTRVFSLAKPLLAEDAVVYVRTDQRKSTLTSTLSVLKEIFPERQVAETPRPLAPEQQVKPYGRGGAPKQPSREMDIILKPC